MEHRKSESKKVYDMSDIADYDRNREVAKSENLEANTENISEQKEVYSKKQDSSSVVDSTPPEEKEAANQHPQPRPKEMADDFDLESSTAKALENMISFKKEEAAENKNNSGLSLQLKIDHEQLAEEITQTIKTAVSTELETAVINTINDNLQSFSDTKEWSNGIVASLEQIHEHVEIEQSKFREWIKKENRVTIISLIAILVLFFSGFISGWKLKSRTTTYNELIANAYNKALERELDKRWNLEQENVRKEAEKIIEDARKRSQKLIEDASKKSTEIQIQDLKDEVREKTRSK